GDRINRVRARSLEGAVPARSRQTPPAKRVVRGPAPTDVQHPDRTTANPARDRQPRRRAAAAPMRYHPAARPPAPVRDARRATRVRRLPRAAPACRAAATAAAKAAATLRRNGWADWRPGVP